MSLEQAGHDWQCVGVAQVGGADILGAGLYLFEFRGVAANFRGKYAFLGGGVGGGGSLGGGAGPSPLDVFGAAPEDLWTPIEPERPFSGDDLDLSYGALSTLGAGLAYGYALMGISAGLVDPLFDSVEVSGWGTGVGASGAILVGSWKLLQYSDYY